jgi:LysM repeat protein
MGIGKSCDPVTNWGMRYNVDMRNDTMAAKSFRWICILFMMGMAACQSKSVLPSDEIRTETATLIPYRSATPTPVLATATPPIPTPPPLPSPTPTYRVHEVKKGEDLGGIAFQYQVSLADLLGVNPDVDPYIMSVGIRLNIPPTIEKGDEGELLPTPIEVQLKQPICYSSIAQGTWCFSEVYNPFETPVENITAIIRIQAAGDAGQQSYEMFPGLNTLPPQSAMPLMAYIPQDVGDNPAMSTELITALPLKQDDGRYVPLTLEDISIDIASRASATFSGRVVMSSDADKAAQQIWILAAAYDVQDRLVGVRRYEMNQTLLPGDQRIFTFDVYSAGDAIFRVDVRAEAMP